MIICSNEVVNFMAAVAAQHEIDRLTRELARAKADLDDRHGSVAVDRSKGPDEVKRLLEVVASAEERGDLLFDEVQTLRARVAELEAERAKMIEGGPMAEPRPEFTADGQRITYIDPDRALAYRVRELEAYETHCRTNKVIP